MNAAAHEAQSPLYSTLATDPDLTELVELFVSELPQRVATLVDQFQRADWDQLGRTAHQLKGAVGSYGFDALTSWAARLEGSVRGGESVEQIEQSLRELAAICQRVRAGVGDRDSGQGKIDRE